MQDDLIEADAIGGVRGVIEGHVALTREAAVVRVGEDAAQIIHLQIFDARIFGDEHREHDVVRGVCGAFDSGGVRISAASRPSASSSGELVRSTEGWELAMLRTAMPLGEAKIRSGKEGSPPRLAR